MKKELPSQHGAGGAPPSPKSRLKRTPVARTHRYRSRPIDAVTRVSKWKRSNAQKHGVFSLCPTILGEDPREFEELHSALIDEWQPSGPTEEDAVFSLANLMWRKCRAQKFVQKELNAAALLSGSPTSVEKQGLILFGWFMDSEPETAFERYAEILLTSANISQLKQKFPRANYESTSEWAGAVKAELESLSPETRRPGELNVLTEIMRSSTTKSQVAVADELNLRERLDAMIARQVKHLAQTKAMKQMLRQASTA